MRHVSDVSSDEYATCQDIFLRLIRAIAPCHASRPVLRGAYLRPMLQTLQNSPNNKADLADNDDTAHTSSHPKCEENSPVSIVDLVDADAIGAPIGVTGRTILNWADSKKIPTALRLGRIVRFDPAAVAKALGIRVK